MNVLKLPCLFGLLLCFSAEQVAFAVSQEPEDGEALCIDAGGAAWGAVSGLTNDGAFFYFAPDDVFAPSRLWRVTMPMEENRCAQLDATIWLTLEGKPTDFDLEGVFWTQQGFWLVSESKTVGENLLLFSGHDGVIQREERIPPELLGRFGAQDGPGLEGVAASPDGRYVYVALQRGFQPKERKMAAILRFEPGTGQWKAAFYPLDRNTEKPKKYWVGISDLCMGDAKTLLVLERDKAAGAHAHIKRVYAVDVASFADGSVLEKKLVCDVVARFGYELEKAEGLTVYRGRLWMINDNNDKGETRLMPLGAWGVPQAR